MKLLKHEAEMLLMEKITISVIRSSFLSHGKHDRVEMKKRILRITGVKQKPENVLSTTVP